jgi:hypothetical protein
MTPKKRAPKDGPHKMRPDEAETPFRVMLEATGQAEKTLPSRDGRKGRTPSKRPRLHRKTR